jgi:integrase
MKLGRLIAGPPGDLGLERGPVLEQRPVARRQERGVVALRDRERGHQLDVARGRAQQRQRLVECGPDRQAAQAGQAVRLDDRPLDLGLGPALGPRAASWPGGSRRGHVAKRIKVRAPRGSIRRHYGKYRAEVMIDGVRARKTVETEEEAQQYLLAVCQQATLGVTLDRARITVAELLELFYQSKVTAGRKTSTLGNYQVAARHVNERLGSMPAQQLLPEHVDRLLTHLRTTKRFGSKHTYAIFAVLLQALEYGVRREILVRNVARVVDRPKVARPEMTIMAQADVGTFFDAIADLRDRCLFLVLLSTGMRRGELVALKWEDLDLATGTLLIRRRIIRSRTRKGYDIDSPKTARGYRRNRLPAPVLEQVLLWKDQQDLERRGYRTWREGGWIFTARQHRQTGKHLDPTCANYLLRTYLKKAELPKVTVHGLRHSFCTWLLRKGVPAKDVQEIVGHSKVSITLDLYWEAIAGAEERVADQIGEILSPKAPASPTHYPGISPKQRPSRRHLRAV